MSGRFIAVLMFSPLFFSSLAARSGRSGSLDMSDYDLKAKSGTATVKIGKVSTGGPGGTLVFSERGLDRKNQNYDRTWYLDLASFRRYLGSRHEHNGGFLPVRVTIYVTRQTLRVVRRRWGRKRIDARYWCRVLRKEEREKDTVSGGSIDRTVTITISADMISKKLDGTTRIEPYNRVRRARYTVYVIPTKDFDRVFPNSIVKPGTKVVLRLTSESRRTHTVPAGTIATTTFKGRLLKKK